MGRFGYFQANTTAADGFGYSSYRLILPHNPLMKHILQLKQSLALFFGQLYHWNSRPSGNNIGNIFWGDFAVSN